MSEEKTVRFGYSASSNITFNGTVDTGITRSEWNEMSEEDKNHEASEVVHELVDVFELDDDEPDYSGRW